MRPTAWCTLDIEAFRLWGELSRQSISGFTLGTHDSSRCREVKNNYQIVNFFVPNREGSRTKFFKRKNFIFDRRANVANIFFYSRYKYIFNSLGSPIRFNVAYIDRQF